MGSGTKASRGSFTRAKRITPKTEHMLDDRRIPKADRCLWPVDTCGVGLEIWKVDAVPIALRFRTG